MDVDTTIQSQEMSTQINLCKWQNSTIIGQEIKLISSQLSSTQNL